MLYREALGAVLRKRRLEQGRTLQEVAGVAAVSTPYLSEIERGRKDASSEVVATIADALRTRIDLLMFDIADRFERAAETQPEVSSASATITELHPDPTPVAQPRLLAA
ncbi:MAG TPA: helix-turn-helix transcriptional regulator [Plantibacter sp.]|uniref:helix-turn-helix domain-containing protein n=1 Tax=unclassified Plantibacter TaxID=2624265 RepID=UPI002B91FFB9|nr:helix-turn-helix transcriptional regulator [Plantibacter sp.]